MKVILIEEARFTEFCDLLEGKAEKLKGDPGNNREFITRQVLEMHGFKLPVLPESASAISKELWNRTVEEIYRSFHYQFVQWAQSHGASCTKY